MNFHCDLYYRNTWTQITINPQIQTYGQLQALILNYLHLSLNRFEAIMVDYQVIGLAGRLLDHPIVITSDRNLQLQVIVNYFPMNLSQPASIFREWLHLQSRQATDLVLSNLYLSLLITNPMANLIQTHDMRLNGSPVMPAQATMPVDQWQSHNLLNPIDQHSPTMTDWTYYQYYYPASQNPVQSPSQAQFPPPVQSPSQAQFPHPPQFSQPVQLNTANLDVVDEADIYSSENSESESHDEESENSDSEIGELSESSESSEDSTPDTQTFEFQLSSNPNISGFMSITDMISGSTNNPPGRRRSNVGRGHDSSRDHASPHT